MGAVADQGGGKRRAGHPSFLTFCALVLPLRWSITASKESRSPSKTLRSPAASRADTCRNTSGPPPSGVMKPYPRSVLKNFTVPTVIAQSLDLLLAGAPDALARAPMR